MSMRDWNCWLYSQLFEPKEEIKDFSSFEITYKYNDIGTWRLQTSEDNAKDKLGLISATKPVSSLFVSDSERFFGGPITRAITEKTVNGYRTTIEGVTEEVWLSKRIVRPAWYLPYANATTNQYDHYPHHTVWAFAASTVMRAFVAAHAGPAATGPTPGNWPPEWWSQMTMHGDESTITDRLQPYAAIQWPLFTYDFVTDEESGETVTTGVSIRLKNGYAPDSPFSFELFPATQSPGHYFWNQYTNFSQMDPPTKEDGTKLSWFADRAPLNRQVFGLDLPDEDPMAGMVLQDQGNGVSLAQPIRVSKRFTNLLDVLQEVANDYGPVSFQLSFEFVDSKPKRMFRVWDPEKDPERGRIKYTVEFSEDTVSINTFAVMTEYPTATVVMLAGRGEGTARTILDGWNPATVETYEYLETFQDAQDTNDSQADAQSYPTQLGRALADESRRDGIDGDLTLLKHKYKTDFIVGDMVTINLLGIQYYDTVLSATVRLDTEKGETCQVRTGSPLSQAVTKNPVERLYRSLSILRKRVDLVEKREAKTDDIQVLPGEPETPSQTNIMVT